jgi:LmbE family N-acetylglucosaminyl deacetylase
MNFHLSSAEVFIPDGLEPEKALARTTHLAIAAHQDDLEIMAAAPILDCFQQEQRWFTGVVVTDGRGSPRSGMYAHFSDEDMYQVRRAEQCKAAVVGEYSALVLLDYPSRKIKDAQYLFPVDDLEAIIQTASPEFVYTHNLADKHDTHVAVALRTIAALRRLPPHSLPHKLYGAEVWRGLDWLVDQDKIAFDLSENESLQLALLGVFHSQIAGGKRYDLASMGRRRANATYFESHGVDQASAISFAMDLTPLIEVPQQKISPFIQEFITRLSQDIEDRLRRLSS